MVEPCLACVLGAAVALGESLDSWAARLGACGTLVVRLSKMWSASSGWSRGNPFQTWRGDGSGQFVELPAVVLPIRRV